MKNSLIKSDRVNNLGLVCITTTDDIRYKTITRKKLLSVDTSEKIRLLFNIYQQNIDRLSKGIDFCFDNQINLYRLTSNLFPFSDEDVGKDILNEFKDLLNKTGNKALENKLRLVMHPDQFVVLSSDSNSVIENSIKILNMHVHTLELLNQPESQWAAMNIHGGKAQRSEKLIKTINSLASSIKSRLTLENDEYSYSSKDILNVCRQTKVAMVFDAHHHVCYEKLESYEHDSVVEAFWNARSTWQKEEWQMVHISNGRDKFQDRAHSDWIINMPSIFKYAEWIEVEAKHKEIAIADLKKCWINV